MEEFYHTFDLSLLIKGLARFYFTSKCWIYTRNVVDFGLFIDIGLHNDGLAHISKLSNNYIKHPGDSFQVGDIVDCYVDEINKDKGKVSLSLIKN